MIYSQGFKIQANCFTQLFQKVKNKIPTYAKVNTEIKVLFKCKDGFF